MNDTNYSEILAKCTISKNTANFLECILLLSDLFEKVSTAIIGMYGVERLDDIINDKYHKISTKLESVLFGFVKSSISENLAENDWLKSDEKTL